MKPAKPSTALTETKARDRNAARPCVGRACIAAPVLCIVALCAIALFLGLPALVWDLAHSGTSPEVETLTAASDADGDGVDDYADMAAGAEADAAAAPAYDDGYYEGGYPPEGRGSCTDLVWHAFAEAGYSLKDMVDADISAHPGNYPSITVADPNIDFRRVSTLDAFFSAYAGSLSCSLSDPNVWQPGDIVVFENNRHIGVCSSERDSRGIPLLCHNSGQLRRTEDYLGRPGSMEITGHYRFDASEIDEGVLRYWG